MSEWQLWRGALWIVGGLMAGGALIGWTIGSMALAHWFEDAYGTDTESANGMAGALMFLVCWIAAAVVCLAAAKAVKE